MRKILLVLLTGVLLTGCSTSEEVLYFQDLDEDKDNGIIKAMDSISYSKIEPGDILNIRITALDQKTIIPFQFNRLLTTGDREVRRGTSGRNMEMVRLEGYLVDKHGTINYPQLGDISVDGLTTKEIEKKLERILAPYVDEPTISVRLVNSKISVIGEVNKPGTFTMDEDKLTLLQALGQAGDLTIKGKRTDIVVIRHNKDNERVYKHIDLTDTDWMKSEYYYLKQDDVIYVKPNKTKVKEAGFVGGVGSIVSVASLLVSLAVLTFK